MAKKRLLLTILSPEKKVFEGEVKSVNLPGTAGSFTILYRHAAIVSSLTKGVITFIGDEGEQSVEINGGFVEKSGETVSVCIS